MISSTIFPFLVVMTVNNFSDHRCNDSHLIKANVTCPLRNDIRNTILLVVTLPLNKGGSFHTNFLNYIRFTKRFFNIQEHFEFSQLERNYLGEKCLPEIRCILHCRNIYIIISAPINDKIKVFFFRCYLQNMVGQETTIKVSYKCLQHPLSAKT